MSEDGFPVCAACLLEQQSQVVEMDRLDWAHDLGDDDALAPDPSKERQAHVVSIGQKFQLANAVCINVGNGNNLYEPFAHYNLHDAVTPCGDHLRQSYPGWKPHVTFLLQVPPWNYFAWGIGTMLTAVQRRSAAAKKAARVRKETKVARAAAREIHGPCRDLLCDHSRQVAKGPTHPPALGTVIAIVLIFFCGFVLLSA